MEYEIKKKIHITCPHCEKSIKTEIELELEIEEKKDKKKLKDLKKMKDKKQHKDVEKNQRKNLRNNFSYIFLATAI